MKMQVAFYKDDERRLCSWVATPPHRRPFQGTTMAAGRGVPHDLMQFVVERTLGIRAGFWGLLAHGAWFASVPGRRSTQPGRALARAHHAALIAAESLVNAHHDAWRRGEATPVAPALDTMLARWLALPPGEALVLDWPIVPLEGAITRGGRARKRAPRKRQPI